MYQLFKRWLHSSESVLTTETFVELKLHMRGVYRTGNHLSGDHFKWKNCGLFKYHKVCSLQLQLEHRWLFGALLAVSCCSQNSHINMQIAAPLSQPTNAADRHSTWEQCLLPGVVQLMLVFTVSKLYLLIIIFSGPKNYILWPEFGSWCFVLMEW